MRLVVQALALLAFVAAQDSVQEPSSTSTNAGSNVTPSAVAEAATGSSASSAETTPQETGSAPATPASPEVSSTPSPSSVSNSASTASNSAVISSGASSGSPTAAAAAAASSPLEQLAAPVEATGDPVSTWSGGRFLSIPLPTPIKEAGKPAWGSFFSYSQPPIPSNTLSADPASFTVSGANADPVKKFTFNLGYSAGRPDGFLRSMMTINNQYPGPLIEVNKGDTVEITVNNGLQIPQGIHWHGIRQYGSNWADGVPGISQCPIPPGGTFTYRFKVPVEGGTFWYHSHYGNTMADGIVGGFIVHDPDIPLKKGVDYDDERVLYLSDHEADQSATIEAGLKNLFKGYRGLPIVTAPESILINGMGQTDCSHRQRNTTCYYMPKQQVFAASGSRVRFRLINTGSHAMIRFSIDGHKLTVVEADDTPLEPVEVSEVPVNTGQRYSVIVNMNQGAPGQSFWMRANAATFCVNPLQKVTYEGILRYTNNNGNAAGTNMPTSRPWGDLANPQLADCVDLDEKVKLDPRVKEDAPKSIRTTGYMNSLFGVFVDRKERTPYIGFGMNGVAFTNYINNPLLSQLIGGKRLNGANIAAINYNYDEGAAVDLVINVLDPPPLSHPFHLHGRPFYVVARGWGLVTPLGKWLRGVNTKNPLRRDTITIPHNSWAILRLKLDNPGVWPLHCHIGWHLSVGKMAVVVVGQDSFAGKQEQPADWKDLCSGLDPNEIGPARRNLPPQARWNEVDSSGTNATLWSAPGSPFGDAVDHPLIRQVTPEEME